MSVLVTGAAGFIGYHFCRALSAAGANIIALDTLSGNHQTALKALRVSYLQKLKNVSFIDADIADLASLNAALEGRTFSKLVHFAAQAGIRLSISRPDLYVRSNLVGHANILELARKYQVSLMLYASSSSVYGDNMVGPFQETDPTDNPVSFYAATKKACEASSYAYAKLYGISQIGFRFFTVYGPMGRPDMAYWIFLRKILNDETINVYNFGKMKRDFTYIDDIIAGLMQCLQHPPEVLNQEAVPHRIYNLGRGQPEELIKLIEALENATDKKAQTNMMPMQKGDVRHTWAGISRAQTELNYRPKTNLNEGIGRFVDWYRKANHDQINA